MENFGGVKYVSSDNTEEKKIFLEILNNLDVAAFRKFIEETIPDLTESGWLSKSDDDLLFHMHEYRSQNLSFGNKCFESRNYLRRLRFCYSQDVDKPLCATCQWFRSPPPDEENACMHLGALPQDISCPGFMAI